MELRGGFDAEPVFGGDDSLSHGSSEVEELQNLLSPNYAGGREQRLSALERIQRGLLEKISGTPGLGPPPPGLLFGDPENDAAGLPYGVAGPRKTWKDVRGEDEDEMEDGQVVLEKEGVSEHTHPYHFKAEYDSTPPGNTLYIRNLRERVGPSRMRQLLYAVFSKFGTLIDVVMLKTKKMRGQAFVCFAELANAVRAKEELDGFSFLNRTLVIQFARTQSYALHKVQGTFQLLVEKRRAEFEEQRRLELHQETMQQEEHIQEIATTALKAMAEAGPSSSISALHALGVHRTEKHTSLLLIENAPEGITQQDVVDVFGQFDGFLKLAAVPNLKGAYLAEYEDQDQASGSKDALDGFSYPEDPDHPLSVGFAHADDPAGAWEAIARAERGGERHPRATKDTDKRKRKEKE